MAPGALHPKPWAPRGQASPGVSRRPDSKPRGKHAAGASNAAHRARCPKPGTPPLPAPHAETGLPTLQEEEVVNIPSPLGGGLGERAQEVPVALEQTGHEAEEGSLDLTLQPRPAPAHRLIVRQQELQGRLLLRPSVCWGPGQLGSGPAPAPPGRYRPQQLQWGTVSSRPSDPFARHPCARSTPVETLIPLSSSRKV